MRYIGVDLAWSSLGRGMTGLCVVENGRVIESVLLKTDAEIVNWLGPRCGTACLVAIDASLIVVNPRGQRECERLVTACFGRYEAGCHPSNTSMPYFSPRTRGEWIAAALGLSLDPRLPSRGPYRRGIEVYPHPAQVALFDLTLTLKYKRRQRRLIGERRAAFNRCLDLMEGLRSADPPVDVTTAERWPMICDGLRTTTVKAEMDRLEDELDAFFCAYVAAYYDLHRLERCRIVGSLGEGYIVTPVRPQDAACLDAEAASRS